MAVRITVTGVGRVTARLRKLPGAITAELKSAVAESAVELAASARRAVQPGDRPSAPGKPPGSRSGRLAASITHRLDPNGLGASVGTDLAYGKHLEFGTRTMPARPWLLPTFERLKPKIRKRLAQAVRAGIRKGAK